MFQNVVDVLESQRFWDDFGRSSRDYRLEKTQSVNSVPFRCIAASWANRLRTKLPELGGYINPYYWVDDHPLLYEKWEFRPWHIWFSRILGGGFKHFFIFNRNLWGNDPIWQPYFPDGCFKKPPPPTKRHVFSSFLTPKVLRPPIDLFVFGSSDPQCRHFQREKTSKQIRPKNLRERGEGFGEFGSESSGINLISCWDDVNFKS